MDLYHIWCNLRPGVSDVDFADSVAGYLGHLRQERRLEGYRLSRRKLGLVQPTLGEFHTVIETQDLAQPDDAFRNVSKRARNERVTK